MTGGVSLQSVAQRVCADASIASRGPKGGAAFAFALKG
jgi:hypothetical protein